MDDGSHWSDVECQRGTHNARPGFALRRHEGPQLVNEALPVKVEEDEDEEEEEV